MFYLQFWRLTVQAPFTFIIFSIILNNSHFVPHTTTTTNNNNNTYLEQHIGHDDNDEVLDFNESKFYVLCK